MRRLATVVIAGAALLAMAEVSVAQGPPRINSLTVTWNGKGYTVTVRDARGVIIETPGSDKQTSDAMWAFLGRVGPDVPDERHTFAEGHFTFVPLTETEGLPEEVPPPLSLDPRTYTSPEVYDANKSFEGKIY